MKTLLTILATALSGTVMVSAQPVITVQPTNQIVLNGSNVTFNVVATGAGLLTYQWRFNGTNLPRHVVTMVAGGGTGGDGGLAAAASLSYPYSVAVDALGDFFIAEAGNNRIRQVDTNGIISTVAGTGSAGFSGDGGTATNASLNSPLDVAVDGLGNVYISDTLNNRIRKVNTNGIITTIAGNGTAAFSGDGGMATNAALNSPSGMLVDAAGDVLVADYDNQRIRRIDRYGKITTIAGNGSTNLTGDGGLATNASLNYPAGVAVDNTGNVYIADYGNSRVRRVGTNNIITTVAGSLPGAPGYPSGDGGPATNAVLLDCVRITTDAFGNLYFDDVYDGLIRQVDTNGIIWTPVTGLNSPYGLAVDQLEDLYIADAWNNRIDKVALLGSPILTLNQVTIANAGNYDVVISDASGSITSSVVSLTVNVPAYISGQPQSQSVSVGSNATFNVTAGGTLPLNYQWLSGGVAVAGATGSNYTFNVTDTNQAGGYSVIITNNYGSVTSSVATLTVVMIPPSIASQPASLTVGAGSNATFSVVASGSPPFNYQWLFLGAPLVGQTNASLFLPTVTTNQVGAYSVWVTNSFGSITSHVATLTVSLLPTITSQPTNQSVLAGGRSLIVAGVAGVGPLTFQWQLNGTNLSNNLITTVAGNGTVGFAGDGGIATTGKVNLPYGVAADSAGNVFIADSSNNRIRKVDTNGLMTTVAGNGMIHFGGDGAAATNAELYTPRGAVVDSAGNLLIADYLNNRIRKVDTNGIITTVAGGGVSSSLGDGGAATNASLQWPQGVALDAAGNLFIADYLNNRIREVDTNGVITTVAGNAGGFSGDNGAATNANLDLPRGVAVDGIGNLFIADANNYRIRKVDAYGVITTIAGNGVGVYSGDGGPATNAGINPYGVAVDAFGDVFIADRSNNRIRRVDPCGIVTTVAGTNGSGYSGDGIAATNARLYSPSGVTVDSYGRILVADTSNNRIRRFGQGPTLVLDRATAANAGDYTLVINSSYGSVTSSIATLTVLLPPAIVNSPANLTAGLGSNATIVVTASGTAPLAYQWLFNGTNLPNGTGPSLNVTNVQWSDGGNYGVIITNNYGSVTSGVVTLTVGVPPTLTSQPTNLMVPNGNIALLSEGAAGDGPFSYQWQFNGTNLPPIIITVAGTNGAGFAGDGGPAAAAKLNWPDGVAVDAVGNVFIADYSNNRIRKVDTNGVITTVAGTGTTGNSGNGGAATNATLWLPMGMKIDPYGDLYFAEYDNGDVRKMDTNGIITRVAGTGGVGLSNDGGQALNTSFYYLSDVALGSNGVMYVAESPHCRIRAIGTNGIVTTAAGNTTGVTGGFSGDGGPATNAQLNTPKGVVVDPAGNLWIADYGNNRIRMVDTNGIINTIVGGGSSSKDGQLGTNTALSDPFGVVVDLNHNLVFTDGNGYRVRKLDANSLVTTVAGGGSARPGDYGPATSASLDAQALAFDAQGNLYIADPSNARVRKVCFSGLPTLFLPNASTNSTGVYSVIVSSPFGSIASSNATLTVISLPVIGTAVVNADGSVTLNLSGTPGVSSRLYAATNLAPSVVWIPIATNPVGGVWQFTDTNAPNQPVQFYRVSTP